MTLLKRALLASILKHKPPKAMVIFGPRRVGKTTLLQQADVSLSATWYTGDSLTDIQALNIPSTDDLRNVLLQGKALVIDEAQRVPDIGLLLKRLVDINATLENPVMIFATGSSSFELASGCGRYQPRNLLITLVGERLLKISVGTWFMACILKFAWTQSAQKRT